MARNSHSPVGARHADGIAKRAAKSDAYRNALEQLRPAEDLARLIIRRRMQLGLTQEDVARRMGTTNTVISRLESGQHRASLTTLRRLAEALESRVVIGFEGEAERIAGAAPELAALA